MTRLIRILLAIPLGLAGFAILATAFSHFIGQGNADDETLITLVIMGFIAIWLARFLYPGRPDPAEATPPMAEQAGWTNPNDWSDDDDWMKDVPSAPVPATASVPGIPAARDEVISSSHQKILKALDTSHAQRKAAKTYENVDQITGSTDQLVDEGRQLLSQSNQMEPGDTISEQTGRRMLKISSKLEASGRRMAGRLGRTADLEEHNTERYLTLIDEITDLAADLGFEARRLLDLDEVLDW